MAKKKEEIIDFSEIIKNNRIPILTLDGRWHELFPEYEKTPQVKALETKLNNLIKLQGKLVNDIKDMKKLKTRLMEEILANMGESNGIGNKLKAKKQDKSQKLIKDINDKTRDAEDMLITLPYEIKQVNADLLVESMKICYERLTRNTNEIQQIAIWVARVREELKDKILQKQDMEMKNTAIYTYMHDMIGPQVIDLFDDKAENK